MASLLAPGEPLLAGISGGPDSVALLDLLVRGGWRPHVCHLNHKLRGAASAGDAAFVRQLAENYGLPVTIAARVVAPNEDACRQARFAFFESVARRTGLRTIALGHTADDQAETFLLRLLRGAGLTGLTGIWPERRLNGLRVIRPLLAVSRAEVLQYLQARGLAYREDASNADRRFLRNRIRHELLPLLEREYNPAIRKVLARTAEIFRAEAEADPVAAERRAIRQLSFAQVEALRQLANRAKAERIEGQWPLKLGGKTQVPELGVVLECADLSALSERHERQSSDKSEHSKEDFDANALGGSPFIRTWRDGDRFQPLGMKGEKKLQDYFVDEKVPRQQRGRVPLLCAADGRIAWVVGHRIAEPFKLTDATRRIVRIQVKKL